MPRNRRQCVDVAGINILADEADGTIGQQDVTTAGVLAARCPREDLGIAGPRPIDSFNYRGQDEVMRPLTPVRTVVISVLLQRCFRHQHRIGCAIFDILDSGRAVMSPGPPRDVLGIMRNDCMLFSVVWDTKP